MGATSFNRGIQEITEFEVLGFEHLRYEGVQDGQDPPSLFGEEGLIEDG